MSLLLASLRFPRFTLAVWTVAAVVLGAGLLRLTVTTDLRVYFSQDNPQLAALVELEDKYRRNDSIFFLINADRTVYEAACLSLVHELTEAGWLLPHAFRSSSMTNYQYSRSNDDALVTRAIFGDAESTGTERVREIVAAEPPLRNALVAEDESVTGVVVLLALPETRSNAVDEAVSAARALIADVDASGCGRIMLAGSATNSVSLGEAVRNDISSLVVLSYIAITLGLLLLLRSIWATALIMIVISLTVIMTMGLFGWLGYLLSPTAGFVPSIVLTIAVADCVHIMSNYLIELEHGRSRDAAIRESLRINLAPVLLTSVTTAIGVLSLNLSDSPPYRDLGNMVASGVAIAFILSLTLLPAAIKLVPAPRKTNLFFSGQAAGKLADWIIHRHKLLIVSGGILLAVVASFVPRNVLTENWHEYFTEHFEIYHTVDIIDRKLGGIHRIYYDLETGVADGIYDPTYAQQLEAFSEWLLLQPG
ncbi:MAG: MMPL family transporter, partial [Gammaproteobacteria bacterium]|nr:MMPL family transporter [Gammaproteobacteria bacterium]